jgi:hypothetical protein
MGFSNLMYAILAQRAPRQQLRTASDAERRSGWSGQRLTGGSKPPLRPTVRGARVARFLLIREVPSCHTGGNFPSLQRPGSLRPLDTRFTTDAQPRPR